MKRLARVENGITVNELVEMCNKNGISLDTKISTMGADTKYVVIDDDAIVLDEQNYLDEIGEEYEEITEDKTEMEHYSEEVGRGYFVKAYSSKETNKLSSINHYDVELEYKGRKVMTMSSGCIGEKSAKYHFDDAVVLMRRIMILLDDYDMACHNKMCYSKNLAMEEPKEGYEEQWKKEDIRIKTVEDWLDRTMQYYGKDGDKYKALKNEFR